MSLKCVAVFSGSSSGDLPTFEDAADLAGRVLARERIAIVCGNPRAGLMRTVAQAALDAGGRVTAVVTPQDDRTYSLPISELVEVDGPQARKAAMSSLVDGFLALPGGTGTLDEFVEQWAWTQVGIHQKPTAILNVAGYYNPLKQLFESMREHGFTKDKHFQRVNISDDLSSLLAFLRNPEHTALTTTATRTIAENNANHDEK